MSVQIECPKCQKKLKVEDNLLGRNIKCPGCAAVFAVKAPAAGVPAAAPPPAKTSPEPPRKAAPPPDDYDEDEAPRRPAKTAPKAIDDDDEDDRPRKATSKAARDDDDEDDRPKKSAAKKSRDEDEDGDDRPKKSAAKKGRDDEDADDRPKKSAAKKGRDWGDDDDEDRPAKKEKKKGGAGMVLAIVGVLVLLLCGGCFGGIYYVYYQGKELVNAVGSELNRISSEKQAQESKEPLTKAKPATFPAGWKEFKQDKYGFSVWLPAGTPKAGPFNDDKSGEFELPVPANQAGGGVKSGYWIKIDDLPTADGSAFLTNILLDQMIGEAQGHVGTINPVQNKKFGTVVGKPGRACTIPDDKGGIWYCRVCLSGTKGYILLAGWDPKVSQTDADLFFDSFELSTPGGGGGKPKATEKAEGPKPAEDTKFASEQQLADAMVDNSTQAMTQYGFHLQLTGKVTKVTTGPGTRVNEIFFEPEVEDLKTKQKSKFSINCRIPQPVPRGQAPVGATVTVRGDLTGGGKTSATLNECVIIKTEPAKPTGGVDPPKPDDQAMLVKAEDFAKDLNDNQQPAYDRYFRKPLQIDGVVAKQETLGDGSITAIFFQVDVKDKKTGAMKPFLINCRLSNPLQAKGLIAETVAVGKSASVRGKLGGVSYIDKKATIEECVLAKPGTAP